MQEGRKKNGSVKKTFFISLGVMLVSLGLLYVPSLTESAEDISAEGSSSLRLLAAALFALFMVFSASFVVTVVSGIYGLVLMAQGSTRREEDQTE